MVPGLAERIHDCVIARQYAVAEVAFTQVEPDAFDWVQFGAVGWQERQGDVVGDGQRVGCVPAGLIHDHDGVLVCGKLGAELVQERLHSDCGQVGQHEGEALSCRGLHGREQVRPGIALVADAGRALAAGEPTVTDTALLAEPGLVLEPERQALARVGGGGLVKCALKPPFANASRAAASALGCEGRAFCRDRPKARISFDMCPSW